MNITNIPAPRVPFIDERTGLMAREWYRFFLNLFVLTGSGNNPITLEELQLGPPNQPDLAELLIQINQNIAPQYEDQSGDFLKTLDTAQLMSMMSQFANAEAAIQGAYLQPVVQTGTIANYNLDNSPTAGGVAYGTGPALAVSAAGTLGQVLTSGGAGAPTWATDGGGTVTSVSVVSANGLAGTVATASSTPAITLSTTITGLLKGNGTAISAATSGTDYAPATSGTSILYGNGSGGFSNVTIGTGVAFAGGTLSATGSGGTVTSVTGTAPVVSSGGATPAISMPAATTSVNGYLTSTDWTTFNNKGNGTVTGVTASSPLASSGGTAPNITITGAALTKTDDTNITLTLGGSPSTALLAAASLTLGWTGQLSVSRGGTGLSSLTAGYIPFGNGTSAFGSDSQLFWDNTNKRLGVNNTGPTYSIDTVGTLRSTSQALFNTSYTSSLPVIVGCDNAATSAVLLIRKGRDIGAGSVDAVGFDALTDSYSALVPMALRGSVLHLLSGGGECARVDSNAYMLVGYTTSNGAYRLQVNSQIFATSALIATSDERYKENLTPLTNALDLVMALEPVSYQWKKHSVHNFVSGTDVGFSAQRTQQVLADTPYLSNIIKPNQIKLQDGSTEGFLGLADGKLIPLLTAALQELKSQFDAYVKAHP